MTVRLRSIIWEAHNKESTFGSFLFWSLIKSACVSRTFAGTIDREAAIQGATIPLIAF